MAYLLSLSETSDVVAEMTSAAFDTLLHVRTDCDDPLSEMVCDDDGAGGSLSRVDFPALPAGDYVLVVDGYGWWSEGTYTLHVDIDSLAPEPTDTADTPDLADIADDPGDGDASAG